MPRCGQTILLTAALILIVAGLRVPLLPIPLERDEGEYAYIAWRLGHNELPYREWVDQKPPAVFYVYRFALSLPFDPVRAIHFVGLLFSAASVCALFFLGLRFMDRFWAWLGAALLALLSSDPLVQGTAANTELFMLCPLILSLIAFLAAAAKTKSHIFFMALSGALIGIAVMFKQVAIVNWFLLVALYPIFAPAERRWRRAGSFVLWSTAGLSAVLGLVVLYFWRRGGLHEFVDNVFTHNLGYISAIGASERLEYCWGALTTLSRTQMIVWAFAATGLIELLISGKTKWFLFLAGWLITSVIGVSASGYFFPHYFQQLLPPLALAAVAGAERVAAIKWWKIFPAWSRRAVAILMLAALPAITISPFLFHYTPAESVRKIYPGNFFAEMPEFARRIETVTPPETPVFIFGAEPELLFYAHRPSATRYIFLFPLYGPYGSVREKQTAAAKQIEHARPSTAVYLPNALFFVSGTDQYFTQWSMSYLQENFYADTWLIADEFSNARIERVAPGREADPLTAGQQRIGAILVRKLTSAP
jgi:4-amino-4-deoxy-L-arabinose transferase-like glycosyltransferase